MKKLSHSHAQWAQAAPIDEVHRRAGGRRWYNSVRKFQASMRQIRVVELLAQLGWRRGVQSQIARLLGVHRSSVSRDIAAVFRRHRQSL